MSPSLFFALAIAAFLFFYLISLVNLGLAKLKNGWPYFFIGLKPEFFDFKVFYKSFLKAGKGVNFLCGLLAIKNLLVNFLNQ